MKDTEKTITQIFWERVEQKGDKPLFIYHEQGDFPPFTRKGKFRTMSWNRAGELVKNIGQGLLALGAKKGEPISIMSATRMEWALADLGLLSIGAATGSIYPNNVASQAHYILNDLNSRFVFVEETWQRNAFLKRKESSPQLEKIITIGCEPGEDPLCMSFDDLIALGAAQNSQVTAAFEDAVAAGQLSDIASYIYTSGTTGIPKGAVHNHLAMTYTIYTGAKWLPIEPGSIDLAFLPMAHIFEQFAGALLDIYRGDVTVAFARSLDKVSKDFGFVKPTFIRVVPRLLEKVYSTIWSKSDILAHLTEDGMHKALEIGGRVRVAGDIAGQAVSENDRRQLHDLEENNFEHLKKLVFGGHLQFMVTGGAPLSKEINEFFWKLGLPVYELYGMTEAGGATTNIPGHTRIGTVGQPWPNYDWPGEPCQFDLSPEGEILVKGPNVMLRYHNKPEETAEAIRDSWLHSGDVARLDEDGYITITDRMKDILITAGGKNVAPIHIEGLLKEDPLISQVVVYGDRKKYLTAIITLDEDELKARAEKLGLAGSYQELAAESQIRAEVEDIVRLKNQELASYETIKKFIILDHDFSIEAGELTPTVKVKRKEIYKKYGAQVDALYQE
ncbi:MAG: long-chain fatty acid--CoA ligase [Chloroflexi bacterium]|nr:long-chain fatty acid--CoA ligase [Chloroflexota bacterium]